MDPKRRVYPFLWLLLTGCGHHSAGSSGPPSPSPPPPASLQSPGGIWHELKVPLSTRTYFIAETDDMKVMDEGPSFGSGAVLVTDANRLAGSYQLRSFQTDPTQPPALDRTCDLDGTVSERASINVTVHCTDDAGTESSDTIALLYDSAYALNSSLAAIAGNYTLDFDAQNNSLNINGDGTVFGLFHNGAQCTVNGRVEIIDGDFDLYRFELTFSSCQILTKYEGQTMTGLAALNLPGTPSGSFLLLLTGPINGRMEVFSLLYLPA